MVGNIKPYLLASVYICCANSLVGARIRPIGPSPGSSSFWSIMCTRRGQINAAVFPLPVLAMPMMSLPLRAIGTDCAWMGVGEVYSDFLIDLINASSKPKWPKLDTGFGGSNPVTLTPSLDLRSSTWLGYKATMSSCSW